MSEAEAEKTGKQRFCERGLRFQDSYMFVLIRQKKYQKVHQSSSTVQGEMKPKLYKRSYTFIETHAQPHALYVLFYLISGRDSYIY